MTPLIISHFATWVLLILLTLAVLALYRHFGQLYMNTSENKSAQGPTLGSSVLSLGKKGLDGRDVYLPDGRPTVMVFADTDCEYCAQIRDELIHFEAGSVRFVLLCSGRKSDVVAWARPLAGHADVIWDHKSALTARYEVNGTPFAVAVDSNARVVGKSIINGRAGLDWAVRIAEDPDSSLEVSGIKHSNSEQEEQP